MKQSFIRKIFKNQRGEGYLDIIIILMISISLIYCVISLVPVFIAKQNLNFMANTLTKVIEITGSKGEEFEAEFERLKKETGLNPNISIEGNFNGDRIQLRERFILTLSDYVVVELITPSFASPIVLNIPITKSVSGMSEFYWKF